jgi:hypothetical protein
MTEANHANLLNRRLHCLLPKARTALNAAYSHKLQQVFVPAKYGEESDIPKLCIRAINRNVGFQKKVPVVFAA